jgi:hypothetical protein
MEVRILGRVRKLLEGVDAEAPGHNEAQIAVNQQLEQLVAPAASAYGEIVRLGRAFQIGNTTAVAAVVAIPSTAVTLALYNNDVDGGRSLIIDWVAASGVAKTAAAGQQQMIGLIGQVRETAPANSALVAKKLNGMGGGTLDTKARSIVGGTALPAGTGIAADWFPIGPAFGSPGAAATPGHGAYHRVDGGIIVPPGRYFALHVIADVVGSTYVGFIGWHERQIQLG